MGVVCYTANEIHKHLLESSNIDKEKEKSEDNFVYDSDVKASNLADDALREWVRVFMLQQ